MNTQNTVLLQTRISTTTKKQVDAVLEELGIASVTDFLRIAIKQLINTRQLNLVPPQSNLLRLNADQEQLLDQRMTQVKDGQSVTFENNQDMQKWLES